MHTRVVVRERKRRQVVEKRLRDVEALARHQLKHYDSTLVEIAKQVRELVDCGLLHVAPSKSTDLFLRLGCLLPHPGIWLHAPPQLACSHTGFIHEIYPIPPQVTTLQGEVLVGQAHPTPITMDIALLKEKVNMCCVQ